RELPGIKQVESLCRKTGAFCYGKLSGFTKTCRSHDGYSAWEGLVFWVQKPIFCQTLPNG
ncbi:hypothetical protein, partial [Pectobacterium versatile]|uniref:hypothetical protein n=1 Tax=Pectobacterium versatile TaxID=2488639 RepID=UPI001F187396